MVTFLTKMIYTKQVTSNLCGNRTVSLAPQFQSKIERIECGQAVEMSQRYASTH